MLARLPAGPWVCGSSAGVWRSLVARFVRDEEAVGSNPATPTRSPPFPLPLRTSPSRATIRAMSPLTRPARWSVALTVAVLAAGTVTATPADAAVPWSRLLAPVPISLADTSDLWDLGVTDVNGDGVPDVFTTDHNERQSVLLGDGRLGFTDAVSALGLDQDPTLPGAELDGPPASTAGGGAYLWREGNDHLVVHATVTDAVPTVDVTVTVYGAYTHTEDPGVGVEVTDGTDTGGRPVQLVHVTSSTTGNATLDLELVGVPTHVVVAAPGDPAAVFVGPGSLHPASTTFDWNLQDRHGLAWADLDGDGDLDAFAVRGGLKGNADSLDNLVTDELFRNDGGHLTNVIAASGIVMNGCRGRRASWVDVDGDGDLDLEVTCEGAHPQLWRRDGAFHFTDASALLPDGIDEEVFVWLDVDGDGRPELVTAQANGIGLYQADRTGRFALKTLYPSSAGPFADVALTDRDQNGTPDLLFVSPRGGVLLTGRANGTFRADDPTTYGLPATARRIAFTDVDRDGLTDLYAMPGGVYRQTRYHHYVATPLLRTTVPRSAGSMGSLWFDADGDGDPDALVGYATDGSKQWNVTLYRNQAAPSHRLLLDLVGPVGNREAIGATVTVVAGGVTTRHWVGEAETSRESQGQYGIDVSLGPSTTAVDSLTIRWPDGTTQVLTGVAADQPLTVTEPGA